jgi:RNA polymerase sigma-70 factor (ECF subfamily)
MHDDFGNWSDDDLIAASATDAKPFRVLYDRWADPLAGYFYRRTWDAEVTRDLVAETFAVVWLKRATYERRPQPGAAWLFGIARKELAMYRRREVVRTRAVRRLGVSLGPLSSEVITSEIEERVDAQRYREALVEALATLTKREREAVVLRVIHDRSYREVASELECSEGAARVRVHRALTKLAGVLEGQA